MDHSLGVIWQQIALVDEYSSGARNFFRVISPVLVPFFER
jgi:hypothetical protein